MQAELADRAGERGSLDHHRVLVTTLEAGVLGVEIEVAECELDLGF